jgi:hypothetical protein
VELAERLIGKGISLVIFDKHVDLSRLVGRNKSYIEQKLPHLATMVTGSAAELEGCQLLLLCHPASSEQLQAWQEQQIPVLDLTGGFSGSADRRICSIV